MMAFWQHWQNYVNLNPLWRFEKYFILLTCAGGQGEGDRDVPSHG